MRSLFAFLAIVMIAIGTSAVAKSNSGLRAYKAQLDRATFSESQKQCVLAELEATPKVKLLHYDDIWAFLTGKIRKSIDAFEAEGGLGVMNDAFRRQLIEETISSLQVVTVIANPGQGKEVQKAAQVSAALESKCLPLFEEL